MRSQSGKWLLSRDFTSMELLVYPFFFLWLLDREWLPARQSAALNQWSL